MDWVQEPIDINGRAQGTPLALSNAAAQTDVLPEGIYDVWSDVDCFIKVTVATQADANDVTTSSGYPIWKDNIVTLFIQAKSKLGGVTTGATGSLSYHKVG